MGALEELQHRYKRGLQRRINSVRFELGALLVDTGLRVLNQYDEATPPTRLNFVGGGEFKAIGFEFLRYFVDIGELKPTDSVLDMGCGIGRMALPMTR